MKNCKNCKKVIVEECDAELCPFELPSRCVIEEKAYSCIGFLAGKRQSEFNKKIVDFVCALEQATTCTKISSDDTCCGNLEDKLVSDSIDFTVTRSNLGCEKLKLEAKGFVKVSADDTCAGYLEDKLSSASLNIIKVDDEGCESLSIETNDWSYASITLSSPWTSFFVTPQYGTQDTTSVKLRGVLSYPSGVNAPLAATVGTLPVGFRPEVNQIHTFVINDATSGELVPATINIGTNGVIEVSADKKATTPMGVFFVSLDPIFFTT